MLQSKTISLESLPVCLPACSVVCKQIITFGVEMCDFSCAKQGISFETMCQDNSLSFVAGTEQERMTKAARSSLSFVCQNLGGFFSRHEQYRLLHECRTDEPLYCTGSVKLVQGRTLSRGQLYLRLSWRQEALF